MRKETVPTLSLVRKQWLPDTQSLHLRVSSDVRRCLPVTMCCVGHLLWVTVSMWKTEVAPSPWGCSKGKLYRGLWSTWKNTIHKKRNTVQGCLTLFIHTVEIGRKFLVLLRSSIIYYSVQNTRKKVMSHTWSEVTISCPWAQSTYSYCVHLCDLKGLPESGSLTQGSRWQRETQI